MRARYYVTSVATFLALAAISVAGERIHIRPQFRPGETLYFRIDTHTKSTGTTTTPIVNPEGGTNFSESLDLLVRIDVLTAKHLQSDGTKVSQEADSVRLRVTYEQAHVDSQADAPQFDAASPEREYDRLQGHAFEFTLEPGGAITDVQDPDNILPKAASVSPALSWMKTLVEESEFPERGMAIGEKWTSQKPLENAPLAGLIWRAESTYLRDEPCSSSGASNGAGNGSRAQRQQCAVILTQFEISRHSAGNKDQTPPDYLHHGLRTMGKITGSGESLDSISIASGLLMSSTQSSTQRADFDIVNAANGEKIHRDGQIQTQTVITRAAKPPSPTDAQP